MNIPSAELFRNKSKIKMQKLTAKNEIIEYVKDEKLYLVLNMDEILSNEKIICRLIFAFLKINLK